MSFRASICGILLILVMADPVNADLAGWNIMAKPSFRVGYLYGSQLASIVTDYGSSDSFSSFNFPSVQLDISFGFPIISGALELSPESRFSARLAADVSVYGQQNIIYGNWWNRDSAAPGGQYSSTRPGFAGFEAAGRFDIWRYTGYRFGVIGGWRNEYWWYEGGDNNINSVGSKDKVTSSIPFVGLCAEMAYPGWRSTWQFLTSPFVFKDINGWVRQYSYFREYRCDAREGVLLEGRIEGEASLTDNLLMGIYGRYSYQNVSGIFDVISSPQVSWPVNVVENTLTLELQVTYLFW